VSAEMSEIFLNGGRFIAQMSHCKLPLKWVNTVD
jgi:hypothetical protein